MKKVLLIVSLIFAACCTAIAQKNLDVLHLDDGTIVKGRLLGTTPEKDYKFEIPDGTIALIPGIKVKKITQESNTNRVGDRVRRYEDIGRGYMGAWEVGYGKCLDDTKSNVVNAVMLNGYRFNPYFYLAGGIGINFYPNYGLASAPLFAHARINFRDSGVTPYFALNAGYNFGSSRYHGYQFEPVLGLAIRVDNKRALTLSLSYIVTPTTKTTNIYYEGGQTYNIDGVETYIPTSTKILKEQINERVMSQAICFKVGTTF